MNLRTCTRCGESKPEICFGTLKRSPDGLNKECRECHAARQNSYQKEKVRFKRKIPYGCQAKIIPNRRQGWPSDIARVVVRYGLEELKLSRKEIAEELGITEHRTYELIGRRISKL